MFLNDPREWLYGADLARDILSGSRDEFEGPTSEAIEAVRKSLDSPDFGGNDYITSFCDTGDLLDQWRGYADQGGGYCAEFDGSALQTLAREQGADIIQVEYDISTQTDLLRNSLHQALRILKN
jgi:hypothetical protein